MQFNDPDPNHKYSIYLELNNLYPCDHDLGNYLYSLYKTTLVCINTSPYIFYEYQNGLWKQFKYFTNMIRFADEMKTILIHKRNILKTMKNDPIFYQIQHDLIKSIQNLKNINNFLSKNGNKSNVCRIACNNLINERFIQHLNSNINILSFGDKVYDLQNCLWRNTIKN